MEQVKTIWSSFVAVIKNDKVIDNVNKKLNRSYLLIFGASIMLLIFGGLGDFTNHSFGATFLGTVDWFGWILIGLSIGVAVLGVVWVVFSRNNKSTKGIETQIQAINIFALMIVLAVMLPMACQLVRMGTFFKQVVTDATEFITKPWLFNVAISTTFAIVALAFIVAFAWGTGKINVQGRTYAWVRNSLGFGVTGSFLIYMSSIMGLGAFGLDLSRAFNTWPGSKALTMEQLLSLQEGKGTPEGMYGIYELMRHVDFDGTHTVQEILFNEIHSGLSKISADLAGMITKDMSYTDLVSVLNAMPEGVAAGILPTLNGTIQGFIDIAVDPFLGKSWFFGANNNWQASLLIVAQSAIIIFMLAGIANIFMKKGKDENYVEGKETFVRTLGLIFAFTFIVYGFDNWVVQYIQNGSWNPGLYRHFAGGDSSILAESAYTGTVYYWIMFPTLFIIPSIIVNVRLMEYMKSHKVSEKVRA